LSINPDERPSNAYIVGKRIQTILENHKLDISNVTVRPLNEEESFPPIGAGPVKVSSSYSEFDSLGINRKATPFKVENGNYLDKLAEVAFTSSSSELNLDTKTSRPEQQIAGDHPHTKTSWLQHQNETPTNDSVYSDEPVIIRSLDTDYDAEVESNAITDKDGSSDFDLDWKNIGKALPKHNSHFVVVKDDELGRYQTPEPEERRSPISLQTILASICLIILGVFLWYMLQPVSADQLYSRIMSEIKRDQNKNNDSQDHEEETAEVSIARIKNAEKNIEMFLAMYPDDSRRKEIDGYVEALYLDRLTRELEQKINRHSDISDLQTVERDCVEALRIARNDPEMAVQKFAAIIDLYGPETRLRAHEEEPETELKNEGPETNADQKNDIISSNAQVENNPDSKNIVTPPNKSNSDSDLSEPTQNKNGTTNDSSSLKQAKVLSKTTSRTDLCVEIARRKLDQLQSKVDRYIKEQSEFLVKRLDAANEFDKIDPEKADKIRKSIIELYKDKPWASKFVEEARKAP
ncbi:MAG: hypothetical protein ACRC2T_13315, partial [Thermoguttaceae bacterium]